MRLYVVLCLLLAVFCPALAQNPPSIDAAANGDGGAAFSWTRDSLGNAVPLPLPRASAPKNGATMAPEAAPAPGSGSVAGEYPKGAESIKPDLQKEHISFRGKKNSGEQPAAAARAYPQFAGALGAPFNSSRLVPADARLVYPYRAVGKLYFKTAAGSFICSGSVIAPRLLLTAGHCVHDGSNGFHSGFVFVPALYQKNAPLGLWKYAWAITTAEWSASKGEVPNGADFEIIELRDQEFEGKTKRIGDVTGWLGIQFHGVNDHMKLLGYPANFDQGLEMHQVNSQYFKADSEGSFINGSDMSGGSSGGPWVVNFGIISAGQSIEGLNTVAGVTSYGPTDASLSYQGTSTPNNSLESIYKIACAHREGNCAAKSTAPGAEKKIAAADSPKPAASETAKTGIAGSGEEEYSKPARPGTADTSKSVTSAAVEPSASGEDKDNSALAGQWLIGESGQILQIGEGGRWFHPVHGAAKIRKAGDAADIKVFYENGSAQCSYRVTLAGKGQTLILSAADTSQDPDYCPEGDLKKIDGSSR